MGKRFTILLIIGLALLILTSIWSKRNNLSLEGIGLKVLSTTVSKPPQFNFGSSSSASAPSHDIWDAELKKYVDAEGWVDYYRWSMSDDQLDQYLSQLTSHPPLDSWSESEQIAYWINVYNAFTIKVILNHYPVESIKDIGGSIPMHNTVWDQKFFNIGERPTSLGEVEHLILRKYFDEPRIHFAINCASISCPILRREAYDAELLEAQLVDQTKQFLSDKSKNMLDANGTWSLSPIFKWFSEDFGSRSELSKLLATYGPNLNGEMQAIRYLEYNWNLNDRKFEKPK